MYLYVCVCVCHILKQKYTFLSKLRNFEKQNLNHLHAIRTISSDCRLIINHFTLPHMLAHYLINTLMYHLSESILTSTK